MIQSFPPHRGTGFSLVELLVVIAVIAVLVGLAVPALVSLTQGSGMRRAITSVSDSLELARTEAMAQSTWVWVGVADTTKANAASTPELAITTVISRDGTRDTTSANLLPLTRPVRVENVKLLPARTDGTPVGTRVLEGSPFVFAAPVDGQSVSFTGTIIAFSPQGEALLDPAATSAWIEIPLREMRGTTEVVDKTASILVSGLSGQVVVNY